MVDKILENYSKAVESTLKLQQEMLRNWTMQLSPFGTQAFELPMTGRSTSASATPAASASATPAASATEKPAAAWLEQLSTAQRKCAEAVADMLKRHQETLDEEYRAGIRAIDDAFRVGEARNPEQFQRLSEELWRRNCEVLTTAVASQMHDVQSVMQKWYEAVCLGAAGTKV
ncbi:MAG: hypothetical protein WBQ11_15895 [Isosphaeraceae bacterium]